MRAGPLGICTLLLAIALLSADPGALASSPAQVHLEDEVNLHELCEDLARECWNLDPAEFGMNPVEGTVPPPPEGTLVVVEGSENVNVRAGLFGQQVHIHGVATVEQRLAWESDSTYEPAVPCSDPDGCPDLSVDLPTLVRTTVEDERTFSADHCAVQENSTEPGQRKLLRFNFRTPNLGAGDLVVGDPDDHLEWFEWGECHGHWHFREYADYRLWDPAGYAAWRTLRTAYPGATAQELFEAFPDLRDHFVAGHKQGFCVIDVVNWYAVSTLRTYRSCDDNQGISVRWADEYHRFLDGQWVDVTGLEPGTYVLEAEVNAERFIAEQSFLNNDAAIVVDVNL